MKKKKFNLTFNPNKAEIIVCFRTGNECYVSEEFVGYDKCASCKHDIFYDTRLEKHYGNKIKVCRECVEKGMGVSIDKMVEGKRDQMKEFLKKTLKIDLD